MSSQETTSSESSERIVKYWVELGLTVIIITKDICLVITKAQNIFFSLKNNDVSVTHSNQFLAYTTFIVTTTLFCLCARKHGITKEPRDHIVFNSPVSRGIWGSELDTAPSFLWLQVNQLFCQGRLCKLFLLSWQKLVEVAREGAGEGRVKMA